MHLLMYTYIFLRKLQYQWFKKGREDPIGTGSKISLPRITDSQYGIYYCNVINAVGSSHCVFNVTGQAYPPEFFYEEETAMERYPVLTSNQTDPSSSNYLLKWTQPNPEAVGRITEYRYDLTRDV